MQAEDHRKDRGREDKAVKSEVPDPPPSGKESSVLSASSKHRELWNRHNESLPKLRSIVSGATARAAEPATTSIPAVPKGSEGPLGSRLRQYQNFQRPNKMETLVVEEEKKKKKEQSSSASISISQHPDPKTTDPPAGGPSPLERLDTRRSSERLSSLRAEFLLAADALLSSRAYGLDGPNVKDETTPEDLDPKGFRAWFREQYCIQRMLDKEEKEKEKEKEEGKEEEKEKEKEKKEEEKEKEEKKKEEQKKEEKKKKEEQKKEKQKEEEEQKEDMCRICHGTENSPTDPLVSPCMCRGTCRFMHVSCLKIWTKARIESGLLFYSVLHCELCRGWMSLDATTINISQLYRVTRAHFVDNLMARYPPRPSRFRRFVSRVRGWMTFGRSS